MSRFLQRGRNVWRRLASSLPLTGDVVSPEARTDLFQAHLSVYQFCSRFAHGKRVLDVGCGTGYGCAWLARNGAGSVTGVDRHPKLIRYAGRRFAGSGVGFRTADAAHLPEDLGVFDLVVAGNLLAQLEDPHRVVAALIRNLGPAGKLIASVPPILDVRTMEVHRAQSPHRSNLYLWDWRDLLAEHFDTLRLFRHLPPEAPPLDLSDPGPSRFKPTDFQFQELPLTRIDEVGSLAALFVCARGRGA